MSSFKRKSYGKVKPVPKAKEKAPARPAVNELKAIFKGLQGSPEWQQCDYLSKALVWWTNATPYIQWKYKKMFPMAAAKAYNKAVELVRQGWNANNAKDQARLFQDALVNYSRYAAPAGIKAPQITPYLKKSRELTQKSKAVNKKLAVRFDPVLTLLAKCFKSCNIELVVNDYIKDKVTGEQLDRKFDHQLNRVYYSRAHCVDMKKTIHRKGLLYVVIEEGNKLARAMAFFGEDVKTGKFLSDPVKTNANFVKLLNDFAAFAQTKEAPKSLVRREKVAKKKKTKEQSGSDYVFEATDPIGEEE